MASPRLLASALRNGRRVLPLMRDERVPTALKASAAVTALLIVSPLDIFSDIPVLGLLDDAMLLTLLAMAFVAAATWFAEKNVTPARRVIGGVPAVRDRSDG